MPRQPRHDWDARPTPRPIAAAALILYCGSDSRAGARETNACHVHNIGRFHIDLGEYRREAVVIERIVHHLRPALGNFKEVAE